MTVVKMWLDRESIGNAIKKLQHYAHGTGPGTLDALIEKRMQVAVNAAIRAATTAYNRYVPPAAFNIKDSFSAIDGGHITVTGYRLNKTTWVIEAAGRSIGFIEFGTGFYADASHPFVTGEDSNVPFKVYPGSWSEENGNTYKEWMDRGADMRKYPWNSHPTRGLYRGYEAARKALLRMTGGNR